MLSYLHKTIKKTLLFISLLIYLAPLVVNGQQVSHQHRGKNNLAYKWGEISMSCTADDTEKFKPRPTVTSRYLGLIWTAVFDAWSRYDEKAIPVYLKNVPRRPAVEHSLRNKETAISYAAYRTMMEYFAF